MSAYQELLTYTRQLERRLAKQERQESGGYTKSEANSLFVTYTYANDNYIDISAYGDFLLATGQANGALVYSQLFSRGIIAGDGVWGSESANGDLILEGTTDATKTSSYVLIQPSGGNVGIGRTPASYALEVAGNIYSTAAGQNTHVTAATSWAATTNASSKLDLTTDAANVGMAMRVAKGTERYTTNATTVGFLQYGSSVDQFELVHGTNTRITVSSTGNVGIGAAPAEKLDVNGNILLPNNNFYKAKNSSGTAIQLLGIDASNHVYMGAVGNAGGNVYIREDGSNVITISGANVGIGTAPGAKLHVYGSSPSVWVQDSGAAGAIAVMQATNTLVSIGSSFITSAVDLAIISAGNEKIRVKTSGNVGIGTTAPGYILEIAKGAKATAGEQARLQLRTADASNQLTTAWRLIGGTTPYTIIESVEQGVGYRAISIQPDGGNVGIGVTAPETKLHVAGIGKFGDYCLIGTSVSGGYYQDSANGAYRAITTSGTGGFYFQSNGGSATRMYIGLYGTYAGNVGIGTDTPGTKLHVEDGDVLLSNNRWYYGRNSSGTLIRLIGIDGSNNTYLGAIDNAGGKVVIREDGSDVITLTGGSVGIGTSAPDAKLEVQVNSGGAINAIEVTQEDVNRAFMNFVSTDVASSGTHLVNTAAVGTYYGKIKIAVNGTYRYIPVYSS